MVTHEETRKEKLEISNIFLKLSADTSQTGIAYGRGDKRGVRRNISQIITQWEKIRKRI